MSKEASPSGRVVDSVADIGVGDGLYLEASASAYWVEQITETRVVLRNTRGSPYTWVRETFEASLAARTWIHQSRASPKRDRAGRDRDADSAP